MIDPVNKMAISVAKAVGAKLVNAALRASSINKNIARKGAEAYVERMRVISDGISEISERSGVAIEFNDGTMKIGPEDRERVQERVAHLEVRRQQNLESIVGYSAAQLNGAAPVPEQQPTPEWIARFISFAQDVSSDDLHKLWGEILAGEVVSPGSFSLRTLDVVRNTTKQEADIFSMVGRGAIREGDVAVLVAHQKIFESDRILTVDGVENVGRFPHLTALLEMGVVIDGVKGLNFNSKDFSARGDSYAIKCGSKILLIRNFGDDLIVQLQVWQLTTAGREMLRLIPDEDPGMEFMEQLAAPFKAKGCHAYVCDFTGPATDGGWHYDTPGKRI